uniref:Uncharacterized protein n=1 Tax=Populus davidiana TaxID=266767 RepID=A0A6M2EY31_9ROSI
MSKQSSTVPLAKTCRTIFSQTRSRELACYTEEFYINSLVKRTMDHNARELLSQGFCPNSSNVCFSFEKYFKKNLNFYLFVSNYFDVIISKIIKKNIITTAQSYTAPCK